MTEPEDSLTDRVSGFVRRRARTAPRRRSLWAEVARVGTLGWMIALPVAGLAVLGHLLDQRFGTGIRWSLSLIMMGVFIGGYNLWRILDAHDEREDAS